jgi:hypothetical protein
MAVGVVKIKLDPNSWTRLPGQLCATAQFESASFDLATEADPGPHYYHVNADDGALRLELGPLNNLDSLWLRGNGAVAIFWRI